MTGDGPLELLGREAGALVGDEVRERQVGVESASPLDGLVQHSGHVGGGGLGREEAPRERKAREDVDDDGEPEVEEAHERLHERDVDHQDVIRPARPDGRFNDSERPRGRGPGGVGRGGAHRVDRAGWRGLRSRLFRPPPHGASRKKKSLAGQRLGETERAAEAGHRQVDDLLPNESGVGAIGRCGGDEGPLGTFRRHAVDDPAVDRRGGQGVEARHLAARELERLLVMKDPAPVGLPVVGPVRRRDAAETLEEDVDRLERGGWGLTPTLRST